MKLGLAAALAAVVCFASCGAVAAEPTVTVSSGALKGVQSGNLEIFKGVPYAAPPVGPLRWAPTAPAPSWSGVRDATSFGAICPQPKRPDGVAAAGAGMAQSEDCLFLNVFTFAGAKKAPVMVWIHGGAFRFGSGSGPIYDGAAFARDGVILVSINYRLGALGWFAHPALTAAAAPDAPLGNYGLMDQMASLKWVKANIAAFGGDPANVTVFGESAGGESVLGLLSTPSAAGLFQKAIVESGGGWGVDRTLADAERQGLALASAAGLGPNATAADLRALPLDKLGALPMTLGGLGLITDGRMNPASVTATFARGRELHVPLMIGSNSYEASLMKAFGIPPQAMLARARGPVRALYPADDSKAADELFTDAVMGAPAHWIAERASATSPTFLYHFAYVPTLRQGSAPGTQHGGEIPFVFETWSPLLRGLASPQDAAMERLTHGCWVAFAKTGAPACGGKPWPAFDARSDELMQFGDGSGPRAGFRKAQYDALEGLLLPRMTASR
jgi:para-nitrobenzyl esterase